MPVKTVNALATSSISVVVGLQTSAVSLFDGLIWSQGGANPQLQFFENFPAKYGAANRAYSNGTLSIQALNLPLSLSFNYPVLLVSRPNSGGSHTLQLGLFSLNGSTLSLANSASQSIAFSNAYSWISLVTSATQNISPGNWYLGVNVLSGGTSDLSLLNNSSVNPANAAPALVMGRMTVSTNAIPASIATSDFDITGSDAMRQPYMLITA